MNREGRMQMSFFPARAMNQTLALNTSALTQVATVLSRRNNAGISLRVRRNHSSAISRRRPVVNNGISMAENHLVIAATMAVAKNSIGEMLKVVKESAPPEADQSDIDYLREELVFLCEPEVIDRFLWVAMDSTCDEHLSRKLHDHVVREAIKDEKRNGVVPEDVTLNQGKARMLYGLVKEHMDSLELPVAKLEDTPEGISIQVNGQIMEAVCNMHTRSGFENPIRKALVTKNGLNSICRWYELPVYDEDNTRGMAKIVHSHLKTMNTKEMDFKACISSGDPERN
jgi:hypothetical protein